MEQVHLRRQRLGSAVRPPVRSGPWGYGPAYGPCPAPQSSWTTAARATTEWLSAARRAGTRRPDPGRRRGPASACGPAAGTSRARRRGGADAAARRSSIRANGSASPESSSTGQRIAGQCAVRSSACSGSTGWMERVAEQDERRVVGVGLARRRGSRRGRRTTGRRRRSGDRPRPAPRGRRGRSSETRAPRPRPSSRAGRSPARRRRGRRGRGRGRPCSRPCRWPRVRHRIGSPSATG